CTVYEPSTVDEPNGLEDFLGMLPDAIAQRLGLADGGPRSSVVYDGTEGELYRVDDDPHQFRNLWDDPGYRAVRSDLVADLYDSLPAGRGAKLPVSRPAPGKRTPPPNGPTQEQNKAPPHNDLETPAGMLHLLKFAAPGGGDA